MAELPFTAGGILATYLNFARAASDAPQRLARELLVVEGPHLSRSDRRSLQGAVSGGDCSFRERYRRRFALETIANAAAERVGEGVVYALLLECLFGCDKANARAGADLLVAGVHPARVETVATRLPKGVVLSAADVRFEVEAYRVGVLSTTVRDTVLLVRSQGLGQEAAEVARRLVLDGVAPSLAVSSAEHLVRL